MKQREILATGVYAALLGYFVILTLLLYRSGLQSEAKILPYLTAAIAIPLLVFKTLRAASSRVHAWLENIKQRIGLVDEHEVATPLSSAELLSAGWLVMFVGIGYVFGLIVGIFVSVFVFISYHEKEYLKAGLIAFVISAIVYIALPVLFNKLLWPGLLASL